MRTAMIISFCLTLFIGFANSAAKGNCPVCPKNDLVCHEIKLFPKPCFCRTCLTRCYARKPVCEKGEVCVLEPVYYGDNEIGETASCQPFEQCPQIQCPNECPESGYFVDLNDCATCLCEDPCKELKCPENCAGSSINPGTEPNYKCTD